MNTQDPDSPRPISNIVIAPSLLDKMYEATEEEDTDDDGKPLIYTIRQR